MRRPLTPVSVWPGTWAYWAPEMWGGQYGKQVDMWSLGVILYIILSGRHPFDAPARSDAHMRRCIQPAEVSFAHASWSDVSDEAKQLIKSLLQLDPSKRLQPTELLRNPWVVGTGVSEVPIRCVTRALSRAQRPLSVARPRAQQPLSVTRPPAQHTLA